MIEDHRVGGSIPSVGTKIHRTGVADGDAGATADASRRRARGAAAESVAQCLRAARLAHGAARGFCAGPALAQAGGAAGDDVYLFQPRLFDRGGDDRAGEADGYGYDDGAYRFEELRSYCREDMRGVSSAG